MWQRQLAIFFIRNSWWARKVRHVRKVSKQLDKWVKIHVKSRKLH